jgi:asparaginyl-tRNA synthetase
MRVRSQANLELLNFFSRRNFVQIHTPIITSSDCEGSGDLFQVAKAKNSNSAASTPEDLFFNSPAFLGVSGQLHAEAFACSMSNVFTFGPTFRAEASQTQQHLAEFWMLEPEMSHASLEDCMNLTRDMIVETTNRLFETHSEDLAFLHNFPADGSADTVHNLSAQEYLKPFLNADSFHVISYTEAIEILQNHKASLQTIPNWDEGFSREHELYLVNQIFNGNPVFVIDYPTEQKAFYMKKNPDQKTVRCMDLLVPIVGEIAGGSEREDSYEVLSETMRQRNLGQNGEYDWYLDLRKFGSVPHAGFGLGFERYLQLVTATRNIRDVIPVPRAYRHCQL